MVGCKHSWLEVDCHTAMRVSVRQLFSLQFRRWVASFPTILLSTKLVGPDFPCWVSALSSQPSSWCFKIFSAAFPPIDIASGAFKVRRRVSFLLTNKGRVSTTTPPTSAFLFFVPCKYDVTMLQHWITWYNVTTFETIYSNSNSNSPHESACSDYRNHFTLTVCEKIQFQKAIMKPY